MKDYLGQVTLLRLLAVLALVMAPHAAFVPLWETAALAALLGWRTLAVLRQWALPGSLVRVMLTVGAVAGVFASYGNINGQQPGTALLALMAGLKLLEMRSRRDVMVTVFLMYFMLLTHFLVSQEIWTILYLTGSTVAITSLLIDVTHTGEPLPLKSLLRMGGTMVGYAFPLMIVMFILFPRIPGPLWGLPADSGAERSGLPDSMTPEGLSSLILSNAVSFRVKFSGKTPQMRDRYWRGPVLDDFDGKSWKDSGDFSAPARHSIEYRGDPIEYEMVLEPQRHRWLLALEMVSPGGGPAGSFISARHQLVARDDVRERVLYRAKSYPSYRLQLKIGMYERRRELQLPAQGFSRTRELAQSWRAEGLNNLQIAQRALQMFRQQEFYYTLQPPTIIGDQVDGFLFDTRKGFCQHYASAFTVLMRAAGIPAHVVIGYQGGEQNEFGDYYVVRQSDAHAWSEIWDDERGWVRIDPTAAVSPDRVTKGFTEAAGAQLPAFLARRGTILLSLQARWDAINNAWNRLVLAYGPELQGEFLAKFGLRDWSDMIIALTVISSLAMTVIGLLMMRQFAPAQNNDVALRLWRRALVKLERAGLAQRADEGPQDFVRRLAQESPAWGLRMRPVLESYLQLRYLAEPDEALQKKMLAQVRAMRGAS